MTDQPTTGPGAMREARYSEVHYLFGTEPIDSLRDQAALLPAGRVLCLAEGRNAGLLAVAVQPFRA